MNELRRRLKDVADTKYGGSVRAASLAAGLNPNALQHVLDSQKSLPRLDTLAQISEAFGWPLEDVIYWALGRERPQTEEAAGRDCYERIRLELVRLGLNEGQRAAFITFLDSALQAQGSGSSDE